MPIGESVVDMIVELVRGLRPIDSNLLWGPGPRAGQALMLATRAKALLEGRLAPSQEDVASLALPILKHRMALSYAARADGVTIEGLIAAKVKAL